MKPELKEWDHRVKAIMGTAPWPYGVTDRAEQERLIRWAEERGLQYAPGRCLHWIAGKKCPEICRAGHMSMSGMDHITGWTRNGKPAILLSQPYVQCAESIAKLGTVAADMGLTTRVNGCGWYGHGTISIEFHPQDSNDR